MGRLSDDSPPAPSGGSLLAPVMARFTAPTVNAATTFEYINADQIRLSLGDHTDAGFEAAPEDGVEGGSGSAWYRIGIPEDGVYEVEIQVESNGTDGDSGLELLWNTTQPHPTARITLEPAAGDLRRILTATQELSAGDSLQVYIYGSATAGEFALPRGVLRKVAELPTYLGGP